MLGREGNIVVDDEGISRHHARVSIVGEQILITDLGWTNGTFVNGRRLQPNVATSISWRDKVGLGKNVTVSGDELLVAARRGRL